MTKRSRTAGISLGALAALAWMTAQAQSQDSRGPRHGMDGRRSGDETFEGRPGERGPNGLRRPLDRLEALGGRMAMNAEQARHFGEVRASALRIVEDMRPAGGGDPFRAAEGPGPDARAIEADRKAFNDSGSPLYATLDERQRALVAEEWRGTFEPFLTMGAGRRRGGPEDGPQPNVGRSPQDGRERP